MHEPIGMAGGRRGSTRVCGLFVALAPALLGACASSGPPSAIKSNYFSPSGPGEVLVGSYQEREQLRLAEVAGSDVVLSAAPFDAPRLVLVIRLGYAQRFILRSTTIGFTCDEREQHMLTISSIAEGFPRRDWVHPKLIPTDAVLRGTQRSMSLDDQRRYFIEVPLPACASRGFSVNTPEFEITGQIVPSVNVAFSVQQTVRPNESDLLEE